MNIWCYFGQTSAASGSIQLLGSENPAVEGNLSGKHYLNYKNEQIHPASQPNRRVSRLTDPLLVNHWVKWLPNIVIWDRYEFGISWLKNCSPITLNMVTWVTLISILIVFLRRKAQLCSFCVGKTGCPRMAVAPSGGSVAASAGDTQAFVAVHAVKGRWLFESTKSGLQQKTISRWYAFLLRCCAANCGSSEVGALRSEIEGGTGLSNGYSI